MSMQLQTQVKPNSTPTPSFTPVRTGLQRKCASNECEERRKKKLTLQRSSTNQAEPSEVPPIVHEVLRSPGQPLDAATRAFFEPRFGHNFSQVRVHADAKAAESARVVNALAYTVGRDVVFGKGQYAPGTGRGNWLVAHELSHVFQQRSAKSAAPTVVLNSPMHEHGANLAADAALDGSALRLTGSLAATNLQRQPTTQTASPQSNLKTKEKEVGERSFSGVTQVVGQDPESLLRLDTVTVIELGADDWCAGCVSMRADLSELYAELTAKPQRMRFRVFSINKETAGNEEIAKRIMKQTGVETVPQTFVYIERTRSAYYNGYKEGLDYKNEIRNIYQSASSQGVFTGMKWGSIIGGVIGGVAGLIGGGVVGGLIGGAIGAAVGLGLGALFGSLFSKDIGVKELSQERVQKVKDFNEGNIKAEELDHSLAEDIVNFWVDHRETYKLDIYQRRVLIKNLIAGFTGDAEERAILKIIENSTDAEILQIFALSDPDAPNLLELESEFQGAELEYLQKLLAHLRERFPVKPPLQKTTGLLIDDPFVQSVLASAFRETHRQEPNKPRVERECCGVFITSPQSASLDKEYKCEEIPAGCKTTPSCPTGEVALATLKKRMEGIAGSFHTHPVPDPSCPHVREAPSAADFKAFLDDLNQGNEHYVVGPLVTYVILRDGSLRVLGNTADLLHVERIQPISVLKPGQKSTLEE